MGDIGLLRGSGSTTERVYWMNKSTYLTADIPSEAAFYPNYWGFMRFTGTNFSTIEATNGHRRNANLVGHAITGKELVFHNPESDELTLRVYTCSGRMIYSGQIGGLQSVRLEFGALAKGIYFYDLSEKVSGEIRYRSSVGFMP